MIFPNNLAAALNFALARAKSVSVATDAMAILQNVPAVVKRSGKSIDVTDVTPMPSAGAWYGLSQAASRGTSYARGQTAPKAALPGVSSSEDYLPDIPQLQFAKVYGGDNFSSPAPQQPAQAGTRPVSPTEPTRTRAMFTTMPTTLHEQHN